MQRVASAFVLAMLIGCNQEIPSNGNIPASSNPPQSSVGEPESTDDLLGRWKMVSLLKNGEETIKSLGPIEIEFANGRQVMTQNGNVIEDSGYVLDPTTTPRSIDIILNAGEGKTATTSGIYEVNGNTARLCMGSGQVRPKEFASTLDYNVVILERVSSK